MSELYTNYTDNQVSVTVPASVPYVDLALTVNGVPFNFGSELTTRLNQNASNPGTFTYTVPYRAIAFEGEMTASWTFVESGQTATVVETYELVTSVYPINKIVKEHDLTTEEAEKVESLVRHIINSYTGQTFGKFAGVLEAEGNGQGKLFLPRRLITLNTVSPLVARSYTISGANFFLNASSRTFLNNEKYLINGIWGYNGVPAAVQQAADILIRTIVSDEPSYRDRYLNAIRSADWRIDYNSRAFDGTGNVTADQLLDPFVLYRIAVI